MDTLSTTALHFIVQMAQQSRRTMDNDNSLAVKKNVKGRLLETSWDFEQLLWQKLLYSVSPTQMTSQ